MMDNKKNSPTASHLWQGFLPFAIYIAVNDLVQIILSFLTDKWIEQGFAFSEVLREYAGNVTLITHLIAAFLGYYAVVRLTGPGPKLMVKPKNHEIAGITGAPETTGAAGTTGDKEDRDVYLLQVLFAVLGAVSLALAVNIGFGILGALDTTNDFRENTGEDGPCSGCSAVCGSVCNHARKPDRSSLCLSHGMRFCGHI